MPGVRRSARAAPSTSRVVRRRRRHRRRTSCPSPSPRTPPASCAMPTTSTRIGTLGFRGEGLAWIGAVARPAAVSRVLPGPSRRGGRCDGGLVSGTVLGRGRRATRRGAAPLLQRAGAAASSSAPRRRRWATSPRCSRGPALSQLGLHLTLRHNGRIVHDLPATAGLLDRADCCSGATCARRCSRSRPRRRADAGGLRRRPTLRARRRAGAVRLRQRPLGARPAVGRRCRRRTAACCHGPAPRRVAVPGAAARRGRRERPPGASPRCASASPRGGRAWCATRWRKRCRGREPGRR